MTRVGCHHRSTGETDVEVVLSLDDPAAIVDICTGVGFFDHMLNAMAFHGALGLKIRAQGDLEVDAHHLVEDVGICLGRALRAAIGEGVGIERFGQVLLPMDESLVTIALDVGGRAYLCCHLDLPVRQLGAFHTDLVPEFLRAFCDAGGVTLHLHKCAGGDAHHLIEAAFKGLGRSLGQAVRVTGKRVPSTKGVMDS